MRLLRSFEMAWRALFHNKSRAILTMLGVIIGVSAVMMMLSLGGGAQILVTDQIQSLGSNLLLVFAGQITSGGVQTGGTNTRLSIQDADAIAFVPGVVAAVPSISRPAQVVAGNQNASTTVLGTKAEYEQVLNSPVERGSFFSQAEVERWERVAVLGPSVATKLFPDEDPIGQDILITVSNIAGGNQNAVRVSFRVIGVLISKGAAGFINRDDQIIIPITTAQKLLFGVRHAGSIAVQVEDTRSMNDVAVEIGAMLRLRHNLAADKPDDFMIFSQQDLLGTLSTILGYFTILLAGIAGISLLVGGIGIMNIMLVSVTERTREIGLRKAIGALRRDITFQFLVEAILLSTTGGAIGILLGFLGSSAIASAAGFPAVITPTSVLLGFLFSMAVGVFFGFYPARRAANLNPIDALRYE